MFDTLLLSFLENNSSQTFSSDCVSIAEDLEDRPQEVLQEVKTGLAKLGAGDIPLLVQFIHTASHSIHKLRYELEIEWKKTI